MEVGNITLRAGIQAQKDKWVRLSLICAWYSRVFKYDYVTWSEWGYTKIIKKGPRGNWGERILERERIEHKCYNREKLKGSLNWEVEGIKTKRRTGPQRGIHSIEDVWKSHR